MKLSKLLTNLTEAMEDEEVPENSSPAAAKSPQAVRLKKEADANPKKTEVEKAELEKEKELKDKKIS